MIGKLTGIFAGVAPDGAALVDVHGVGYALRVPSHMLSTPEGAPCSLYVHTAVREDAIDLYGFATEEELTFFKQLMSVSGVGPRSALGVLNAGEVGTIKSRIAAGDASALTKVFGIGKKSAERIVVELRDKVAPGKGTPGLPQALGDDAEVIEALMALGYRADESRAALRAAAGGSVKDKLGAALRHLGSPTR